MRLLIACPKCKRQYDATGKPIGGRFHCRCGEALTVERPAGHDSAVVRCSSCGAPRQGEQERCGFCGADFTLREQHLETICPNCFARLGDSAKFCDHCGHTLAAQTAPVNDSPLACPSCQGDRHLSDRQVAGYAVLECKICGGFWVDNEVLKHLLDRAAKLAEKSEAQSQRDCDRLQAIPALDSHSAVSKPHGYLPCPVCRVQMLHQNFGHRSGVVIDVCKHDGVWFDANKLPRLLDWVRAGGLTEGKSDREAAYQLARALEFKTRTSQNPEVDGHDLAKGLVRDRPLWHWFDQLLVDLFFRSSPF